MKWEEAETSFPALTDLLGRLQEAYHRKNPAHARAFVRESFVPHGAVLIIGTESGEWFQGTGDITKLFYWDWELWGRVDFGFPSACWICCNGQSAQIASTGQCVMVMDEEATAREYLNKTLGAILGGNLPDSGKLLEILRTGMHAYTQVQYGETYSWPIRFSAFAESSQDVWLFSHMHFSIPSPSLPAVRGEIPFREQKDDHPFFRDIPD